MEALTNSDRQMLQSTLNSAVRKLKERRSLLGQRYHKGLMPAVNYWSGHQKLSDKIAQLHNIKTKLGVEQGFSQQPGSIYRDQ